MTDNTTRFDGKGEIYAKARPKYAPELFEYMKNTLHIAPGSVFADIGSGTGIFTRQLLDIGCEVFAVEPNADMRARAERRLSCRQGFASVNGSDARTGLQSKSVDFVSAAQAFHWFDKNAFRTECARILKPGGRVMLVYNFRVEAECTKALAELRRKYSPDFKGFSNGVSELDCIGFFGGRCDIFRADNTQHYDRCGYIDRALSSSYSKSDGEPGYGEYLAELNRIFDEFSHGGSMAVPMETVAYIGTV